MNLAIQHELRDAESDGGAHQDAPAAASGRDKGAGRARHRAEHRQPVGREGEVAGRLELDGRLSQLQGGRVREGSGGFGRLGEGSTWASSVDTSPIVDARRRVTSRRTSTSPGASHTGAIGSGKPVT